MRSHRMVVSLILFSLFFLALVVVLVLLAGGGQSLAQAVPPDPQAAAEYGKWGFIAAALAVGIGSLGAGIAVAVVGSAAMGAMSEKPELGGRALIFLGLAEGIAIYGLIIAIMILGKF